MPHPNKWIDIKPSEKEDYFEQIGDTEGGRWLEDEEKIKEQINTNKNVANKLDKTNYIYHPLVLE